MKHVTIRIAKDLFESIVVDLQRNHEFASERIGFVIGRTKVLSDKESLVCISEYVPVKDDNYIEDYSVGARINSDAIREAMQLAIDRKCSIFHVHKHLGVGTPSFSSTDMDEIPNVVKAFVNVNSNVVHGALLFSDDTANAFVLSKGDGLQMASRVSVVGYPLTFNRSYYGKTKFDSERYDRQSFLGRDSQKIISTAKIGVVGLGGGGSHIVQQLAHLGVLNYVLFDADKVEKTNLNRLVGATLDDAKRKRKKVRVAKRMIKGLHPTAIVEPIDDLWQNRAESLQSCDVVIGAVDSFSGRRDLELACRRFLIPYIDIGMDVREVDNQVPRMYGQVILSMPGKSCMNCLGFLTEENLGEEAERYGDAGSKPQVVWSNGVLASTAVGLLISLLTGWSGEKCPILYHEYDGNAFTLKPSPKLPYLKVEVCPHFPISDVGPPIWV